MKQSALFLANVRLGSEIFETSFDVSYVVDGDTEVADAKFCRAIPRLEYRDVVKAVGERDVAGIRAAELAHRKRGGVETRQVVRMFGDYSKVASMSVDVCS